MKLTEIRAPATDSRDILDDFFEKLTEKCIDATRSMRDAADLVEVSTNVSSDTVNVVNIVWKLLTDTPGERVGDAEAIIACKLARQHMGDIYRPPIWKDEDDRILIYCAALLPWQVEMAQDREYAWKLTAALAKAMRKA